MANRNDGPGIDALRAASDDARKAANDGLDELRRAKRRASDKTADDVHRGVVETAKREGWTHTGGPTHTKDQ